VDLASLLGLIIGFVLVVFGILQGAGSVSGLVWFLDAPSALITFGGSIFATMASCTMANFVGGLKSITLIFKP
jgi:Flagellar motor component